MARPAGRFLAPLSLSFLLGGCLTIGPDRLSRDEIDFSRSLAISQNQQTLLNIVRLRYAEAPTFIDLTQVISGYQSQQNVTGSFDLFPRDSLSTYLGGGGSMQLQESPTFTYEPVTGEQFAETFLRPLSPATVLTLALGGIPIDVVLSMVAQSINDADNAEVLSGSDSAASPQFRSLIDDLRRLQEAGLLDVEAGDSPAAGNEKGDRRIKGSAASAHDATWVVVRDSTNTAVERTVLDTRRLLGLAADVTAFDIVYGRRPSRPREVALLTRSLLATLGAAAFAIDVPPTDIASGRTRPTVATASPILIHSGWTAPSEAFVAAEYDRHWYWIRSDDFQSKLAFAVLQNFLALAATRHSPGAVVTIPAG